MGYCHIQLSKEASRICTIILTWGKYQYRHLTMEVSNSPELFEEKMNEMFRGFEFIQAYINNLLIITKDNLSHHLEKLELKLQKLRDNGIKCNIKNHSLDKPRWGIYGSR